MTSNRAGPSADQGGSGWRAYFPPARWLATYEARWLVADLVAGITVAAYAIPVALAYAGLARLSPEVGIYGYILGGLGYALLGSSRQLAIGPTSAISLMVGATIGHMAGGDASLGGQIATIATFTMAGLTLIAWVLRLSTLTSFISETILLGFKAGAALSIASTQLPSLLGVAGGGDNFFTRLWILGSQMAHPDPPTTMVGLAALALLLLGERFLPGRPVALVVVALSIAAVARTSLGDVGLKVVGDVAGGLPSLALPQTRLLEMLRDVDGVIPLGLACLLLAYIEGVSAARTFAEKHDQAIDVRQELLALGGANVLVALGGGYPVAGGLSQSAVNDSAGARTPLALVIASATLALCLVFLTGLVRDLPKAVLAAVVLVAVKGLIDLRAIGRLRRLSPVEYYIAILTFVGVLVLGVLKGVMLAALASILMLLHRAASPHVAFLGRIPGTRRFSDLSRHPDNEPLEGVLVVRVEAPLLYFNVDNVQRAILARLHDEARAVGLVVWDLSTSPYVDLAGARMLEKLSDELAKGGIALRVANAHAATRDLLRTEGADAKLGNVDRTLSLADVIDHARREIAPA